MRSNQTINSCYYEPRQPPTGVAAHQQEHAVASTAGVKLPAMYLNREEGSTKGKTFFCGEPADSWKVLSPPLTRSHLSEGTLKVGWCCGRAVPAPPPCVERVGCHYVTGVQLIAWREDAGHYPRVCLYPKLHRRRWMVNLLEDAKPLRHMRDSAGALGSFARLLMPT